ncbi:MAG: phosphatase PAP2 family protein [Thermomicrobiales bacterium]|nr:phosphatase PAP2 family protein [Thermomicrobiales bacterium]
MGKQHGSRCGQNIGWLGAMLIASAIGVFAFLFRVVRAGRSDRIDLACTLRVQRVRAPWFDRLMRLVSWAGFPPQSRIIPWLAPLIWLARGQKLEALFQILAWGTGVISFAVKFAMRRPRPDHPEVAVATARIGGTSFPSGHVLNYLGVYGFLTYILLRNRPLTLARGAAAALLGAMLTLVGLSRVYLGHHWLSDVSASYLLGLSYLFGLTRLYEWARRRLDGEV